MSNDVERYYENVHGDGLLYLHPEGEWCRYEHVSKRDAEIERLRAELAAAKSVIENIVVSEVEPLKALLRELIERLDGWREKELCARIRAALGEET